jgi:hypothetical protein
MIVHNNGTEEMDMMHGWHQKSVQIALSESGCANDIQEQYENGDGNKSTCNK